MSQQLAIKFGDGFKLFKFCLSSERVVPPLGVPRPMSLNRNILHDTVYFTDPLMQVLYYVLFKEFLLFNNWINPWNPFYKRIFKLCYKTICFNIIMYFE